MSNLVLRMGSDSKQLRYQAGSGPPLPGGGGPAGSFLLAEVITGPGPEARGGSCAVVSVDPWILWASCILRGLGRVLTKQVVRVISSLYPSCIDLTVRLTLFALALVLGLKPAHEA